MGRPKMTDEQKAQAAELRAQKAAEAVEVAPEPAVEIPSLRDYIVANERDDIVLVRVTYPGASRHIYQGRFSGIEVTDGPLSCQWSDGTKT